MATAIAELRAHGNAARILVVDLDLHDGDGTRSIFAADRTVHTFSIHNYTSPGIDGGGGDGDRAGGRRRRTRPIWTPLRSSLPPVVERFAPELVFYLAGCDPAADDQIGDWKITAEAMLERDRFVLSCVRAGARKLPLVIALAGGYGLNAWRYSARFLSALLNRGRAVEPPSTEELLLTRYRSLARELEEHELTGEPRDGRLGALGGGPRERPRRPPPAAAPARLLLAPGAGADARTGRPARTGAGPRLRAPAAGARPRQPGGGHRAPLRRSRGGGSC